MKKKILKMNEKMENKDSIFGRGPGACVGHACVGVQLARIQCSREERLRTNIALFS